MNYGAIDVQQLVELAWRAGEEIMDVYSHQFPVEIKSDNSPLTAADKRSNAVIIKNLKERYPDIPFISEESKQIAYDERKNWKKFWLIDPLDGTKEFIKKNGEFTVNIALIEEGIPVIGIVYQPVKSTAWIGVKSSGSFKTIGQTQNWFRIENKGSYLHKEKVIIVASRSHLSDETLEFVQGIKDKGKEVDFISSGSSLKFCLVAEGAADVYPRFGPTMEWDTAAAHAVVLYAGKEVVNPVTGKSLEYNKENLLNPYFIVQ